MEKFVITNSPFIKKQVNSNTMFLYVAISVFACIVAGIFNYGVNVLWFLMLALSSGFLSEYLFNFFVLKKNHIEDYSFLVTSLIVCATFPINTPLYVVPICVFISVFVIKLCFGGLGKNFFNPALIGRLLGGFMVLELGLNYNSFEVGGENFTSTLVGGENLILDLLTGKGTFGVGTGFAIVILICLVFLIVTRVIDFKIPFISIVAFVITGYCLFGFDNLIYYLLSGSFLFVSIFMLTDPNTSPNGLIGKFLYSALFGVLCAFCFKFSYFGENAVYVVALLVNILAPIFDRYIILRPLHKGGSNNAR